MAEAPHTAPTATSVTQYITDRFSRLTPEEKHLVIAYAELLRDRRSARHPASRPR